MNYLTIFKINDPCLLKPKYELWVNGHYYSSNMSHIVKNKYISKFKELGYTIISGRQTIENYIII